MAWLAISKLLLSQFMKRLRFILLLTAFFPALCGAVNQVLLLELDGIIGPASKDFIVRGLQQAEQQNAALVVIRMNTPGGLDSSMRDIVKAILASSVPVASYVAPEGSRAASAGTYILYASHIAAMAPATNLGAATPVQIGGDGLPTPRFPSRDEGDQSDQEESDSDEKSKPIDAPTTAMERKILNDARAYIRSLAQLRNRNVEWAEQAVQDADSLSATEALEQGVIDIVANDVSDLLRQSGGRTVIADGKRHTLVLIDPLIEIIEPDWRNRLLAIITHPQVAYILMLLGIYGLFFELSNPGGLIPGVLGGICILLALFAFQVLPVNYAGLALIVMGIMFMVAEAFVPSFGILGVGGVIAFVVGSLMLWDERQVGYEIPLSIVLGFAAASAVLFVMVGSMVIRNRRRPAVTGAAALIGSAGVALEDFTGQGKIQILGELWQARSEGAIKKGQTVRVVGREGLKLIVRSDEDNTHDI